MHPSVSFLSVSAMDDLFPCYLLAHRSVRTLCVHPCQICHGSVSLIPSPRFLIASQGHIFWETATVLAIDIVDIDADRPPLPYSVPS